MTKPTRDEILMDNWESHTYKELSEMVGWNAESVRKWGSRNKMPHKKNNAQTKPRHGNVDIGVLKGLIKKGALSVVEIANYFDVAPQTALEAIKELQAGHTVLEVIDDKVSIGCDLRTNGSPQSRSTASASRPTTTSAPSTSVTMS
jgi:predicted RNA binding protein YcfA (HicA-like mRNA interferase family)